MVSYIALIHKDADSDYGVSFPDLPGCVTGGRTLDEARAMAPEAPALHLAGLVEDKEPIPEPSSLEVVMATEENRGGVAILVEAPARARKAVRINITLPEEELERIDAYAEQVGMTRSGFLAMSARRAVRDAP